MGKLTQAVLLKILNTMIRDDGFVESLSGTIDRIFDISPPDLEMEDDPFEGIVNEIMKNYQVCTGDKKIETPGLRNNLISMLREKEFYSFIRILKMLQNLFDYPDARIFNFLKKLKFQVKLTGDSISPWIDIQRTAESIVQDLNPSKMTVFARLSPVEMCLLQGFTSEQIDVMSKFSSRGINLLSKIGLLPTNQRTMILNLVETESELFRELGYDKIRLLSVLEPNERDTFLELDLIKRSQLLRQYSIDKGERQDLLNALVRLETEKTITLRKLIEREKVTLEGFTQPAGDLAENINDLSYEEKQRYFDLNPVQVMVMQNLNDHHRTAVSRLKNSEEVLKIANDLHPVQRDLIFSLRKEEIEKLIANGPSPEFQDVYMMALRDPEIIQFYVPITMEEENAVLGLNQQQRSVLAKYYSLGHDGLLMIDQLGPDRTSQVFEKSIPPEHMTVLQLALAKKISNANFKDSNETELSTLFEIISLESRNVLLDLSWKSIQLLKKMANLNETMIGILRRLSDHGMGVLIDNDQLTGDEITTIGSLDAAEGRILINLNLNQREFLSRTQDFTDLPPPLFTQVQRAKLGRMTGPGLLVLRKFFSLSRNEKRLYERSMVRTTTVLDDVDPDTLNLFASHTPKEINLLSLSMIWHFEENLIFDLLEMKQGTSLDTRTQKIRSIVNNIPDAISNEDQHQLFALIAGSIEVLRMNGAVTDNYVESITTLIEEITHEPTLSLMFKLDLLKFSMRDSKSLASKLIPKITGTAREQGLVCLFHDIRTMEDLFFIRWMLSETTTLRGTALYEIVRGILMNFSYTISSENEFKIILSKSGSKVDGIDHRSIIQGFRSMLEAKQYALTTFFILASGEQETSDQAVSRILETITKIFNSEECYQILNSPATDPFLARSRNRRYLNIAFDIDFPNPNILEVALYYNRGDVHALSGKLEEGQLWALIEKNPRPLLKLMVRNFRTDLIDLYGRSPRVRQLIDSNREWILESIMGELRDNGMNYYFKEYELLGRGMRNLAYRNSFVGRETYVGMVTDYIVCVQGRVSKDQIRILLNSFVSRDVGRRDLIEALENKIEGELYTLLKDGMQLCGDVGRAKRGSGRICFDSRDTKEITSDGKQRIMRTTFHETQTELYQELLAYSERRFQGDEIEARYQQELITRMRNIPPDSLDPRIEDIVATLDEPQQFDNVLKQSGTLNKIERVASATGLAMTIFFVGKHIVHEDGEKLEDDALYLWAMPKIGERLTDLLEERNPIFGSAIGRVVGNFAAYLGLVESIISRTSAADEVDEDITDVNIITNGGLVALDVTAVGTRILAGLGIEYVVVGTISGPLSAALTVPIVFGSYLIDVGFEMEKVTKHLQLSGWEKVKLYWDYFLDEPVPDQLKIDMLAEDKYAEYISDQLKRFRDGYDRVAVSLPSFFITGEDKNMTFRLDFSHGVRARDPFARIRPNSRLFSKNFEGYDLVCGPSAEDAEERIVDSRTKELFIPSKADDDCQNIVSFRKHESSSSPKTFLYVASNASIDLSDNNSLLMVFHGKNLILRDRSSNGSMNIYHIQNELGNCYIHKKGQNLFYVVAESFKCDLGDKTESQLNAVVVRNDFKDSKGIDSIIGSNNRERIEANYAEFVDGNGGGDIIKATENTIVKGYFNDFIIGNCTVMLPLNVSEIAELVANTRISIIHWNGSWIEVDGNARILTADDFLISSIRISNVTRHVIRAHITKTFEGRIFIENELPLLRNLTIPNCKLVKQVLSKNYDIVLSDMSKTVFDMNKNAHWYYWEAVGLPGNLYILRKMFAKVFISNANGILDFRELNLDPTYDRLYSHFSPEGGFEITVSGLQVILLAGYGNVKMTFDGKKYFKLAESRICRDWCTHSLPVVGRVSMDGKDLRDQSNCFEFQSDKIFFFRLQDDLLLVAGRQLLTISDYYPHLHRDVELSLKLQDGQIMEAPGFKERADRAFKVVYYDVGNSELQIYHNQPVDEHHIGFVDLKDKSIKETEIMIDRGRLLLSHRNSTLVRIENWDNYEPARDMVFAFEDRFLPNVECVFTDCDPEDIIDEFNREKYKRSATSGASRGSSWINTIATLFLPGTGPTRAPNKFNTDFCISSNVNLFLVLLQNFLDRIVPLPRLPTITTVEMLANVIELVEEHAVDTDPYQLYTNIVKLAKNERHDAIHKLLELV